MHYLTADYIFPISSPPIKNGIIALDENETIVEVFFPRSRIPANAKVESYKGIICPGFINTHCHLELSHMKGAIDENLGMAGFIKGILSKRNTFTNDQALAAIEKAEQEMIANGIVAVGDISNDDSTFAQKIKGNLKYHTFFEVFDLNPLRSNEVFNSALKLQENLNSSFVNRNSSIVPHAPYSVSPQLFKLIKEHAEKNNSIISYHNQESLAESELFISKSGSIFDLFSKMGINLDYINKTGENSLRSTLPYFSKSVKMLWVHNTFASREDILFTQRYFEGQGKQIVIRHSSFINSYWCFCPNANLYIENKLPDYQSFVDANATCTIGTDSLASNHSLSILDELKVISKHAPQIPLQTLLTWATLNGASFLGFENELGSIEKGKKPGLNLIEAVDVDKVQLCADSKVKKLV